MQVCLAFSAGAAVAAALSARVTTPAGLLAGLAAAGLTMAWPTPRRRGRKWCGILVSSKSLIVSAGLAALTGALAALLAWGRAGLPASLDGASLRLAGTVLGVADTGAFTIGTTIANLPRAPRRAVQVYAGRGQPRVFPGDRVTVSGILALPRPPGNPGGFDYAVYSRATGIAGTLDADGVTIVARADLWHRIVGLPARVGERAAAALRRLFPEPQATLLYGLIFGGDSDRLPADLAADFRRAGVLHLLAASGSNVAFIFGAAVWVLRRGLPSRPALTIGLAVIGLYWLMTGGGASIGRAALMAAIVIFARFVRRKPDWPTSLAVVAAALTVANPLTALDAGFQLSFGATWGLLALSPAIRAWLKRRGLPDWLAAPLAVTFGAQAGVLPVSMNLFGEQSLVSPVTNLIALPLAGGAVVAGSVCCLLGVFWPPLAVPAAAATSVMLRLLTLSVAAGAHAPFATIALPAMPLWWAAAYYVRIRAASARRFTGAAIVIAVLMMAVRPAHSGPGSGLRLTFIDVRQGDSILVEFPDGRRMLVDCGDFAGNSPTSGEGFAGPGGKYDAAGRAIVPFLRRANILRLDAVIITHDHADHNGGLAGLTGAIRTDTVLTAAELAAGKGFAVGGARVDALWPPASANSPARGATGNDDSVVLRVSYAGLAALLTGDAEAGAEAGMVRSGARLTADVLKVAHHGGANSTGAAFLTAVGPRLAVISVGARNRFGHPSLEALVRLRIAGAEVLRTDRDGAVRVAFEPGGMRVWRWDGRAWRGIILTGTRRPAAKHSRHGLHCSQ